jgi:hypothetical protein
MVSHDRKESTGMKRHPIQLSHVEKWRVMTDQIGYARKDIQYNIARTRPPGKDQHCKTVIKRQPL